MATSRMRIVCGKLARDATMSSILPPSSDPGCLIPPGSSKYAKHHHLLTPQSYTNLCKFMLDELGLSFEALLECGDPFTVFEHGSLCPRCMLNRANFGFLFSYFRVLSYLSWILSLHVVVSMELRS